MLLMLMITKCFIHIYNRTCVGGRNIKMEFVVDIYWPLFVDLGHQVRRMWWWLFHDKKPKTGGSDPGALPHRLRQPKLHRPTQHCWVSGERMGTCDGWKEGGKEHWVLVTFRSIPPFQPASFPFKRIHHCPSHSRYALPWVRALVSSKSMKTLTSCVNANLVFLSRFIFNFFIGQCCFRICSTQW